MWWTKTKLKKYIESKINGYHFEDSIFGDALITCTGVKFGEDKSYTIEAKIERLGYHSKYDEEKPVKTDVIWSYNNSFLGIISESKQSLDNVCKLAITKFKRNYKISRMNERYAKVGVELMFDVAGDEILVLNARFVNAMAYLNKVAAENGYLDDNKEFNDYKDYILRKYANGLDGERREVTKDTTSNFYSFESWQEFVKSVEKLKKQQRKFDEADYKLISKESLDELLAEVNNNEKRLLNE